MKIDLKKQILGLDGKAVNAVKEAFVVIKDLNGKEDFLKDAQGNDVIITKETPNDVLTVKKQLINVLLAHSQNMTPAEKAERFALFFRIENCTEGENLDLSAEEISLCKKCNNEMSSTLIAGRTNMILEGK